MLLLLLVGCLLSCRLLPVLLLLKAGLQVSCIRQTAGRQPGPLVWRLVQVRPCPRALLLLLPAGSPFCSSPCYVHIF
jgi:hypothetical protein